MKTYRLSTLLVNFSRGVYISQDTLVKFRQFFNRKTENSVIVMQYQQSKNIRVRGEVTITTYRTVLKGIVDFKYCPNTEFCRVVVKPMDAGDYFRIKRGTTRVEVRFPLKLPVQVVSIDSKFVFLWPQSRPKLLIISGDFFRASLPPFIQYCS